MLFDPPEIEDADPRYQGWTPEKRMLIAILRRAVFDFALYRDPKDTQHDLAVDAAEWLFSGSEEPMSFLFVCEILELQPQLVRDKAAGLFRDDIKRISQCMGSDE